MIQVECECGRLIRTNDENAGRKAKCPECGDIVQIPSPRGAMGMGKVPRLPTSDGVSPSQPRAREVRRSAPSGDEFNLNDLPVAEYADDDDDVELRPPRRTRKKAEVADSVEAEVEVVKKSPKKKKKSSKVEDNSSNNLLITASIFGGVAFLAVGIVATALFAFSGKSNSATAASTPSGSSPAVSAPASERPAANALPELEKFTTEQGELSCLAPKGWEIKTGGGTGGIPTAATFEKGKIKVQFRSSPSGTQIGAIAQAGATDPKDLPESMRPVSVAHDYQKQKFSAEVAGYQESGEPQMFKTAGFGGEGRLSTFTASDGLFGTVYGYRATLLGTNHQWNVVCKCPAGDWKKYQPMFRQILESASGH